MDEELARGLIDDTFNSRFDREKFIEFVMHLFKLSREEIENTTKGPWQEAYVPLAFQQYISRYEVIARCKLHDDSEVDALIVYLQDDKGIDRDRSRTMERNFIGCYLAGRYGGELLRDGVIVAFVPKCMDDWRFSFVMLSADIDKADENGRIVPAIRWSFLVGANEHNSAVQNRILPLLKDESRRLTLADLKEVFNVETIAKEFFNEYRDLFIRTKIDLDRVVENDENVRTEFARKDITTVDFAKKLLGQITFLYFLQKKGWFGVEKGGPWGSGPRDFLRQLYERRFCDYVNFYNDVLEPFFYEALRTDRRSEGDYYDRFGCKIPFLNGGLFDPMNGYDWLHTEILLPNELFSSDDRNGILDVFDNYAFTVNEEEQFEKEVALDPELLGKIYEKLNAIRQENFDEYVRMLKLKRERDFNKEYGVYYTSRDIVHYMCQESLISYLESELSRRLPNMEGLREAIETFVRRGEFIQMADEKDRALIELIEGAGEDVTYKAEIPEFVVENAEKIDELLAGVKICDPAVGSGAFPIGMIHEITRLRKLLSMYTRKYVRQYDLKRYIIENSIYGVDVDPGAVEICKLRAWLYMIVDEDGTDKIEPLPNLDYKIVHGDALLNVEKNLFNMGLFKELEGLKYLYFNEIDLSKKQEYRTEIERLIYEITNGRREFDFEVYFSEVFHQKGGFDIVIGNPPYIQLQKPIDGRLKYADLYKNEGYELFDRTGDIYCLFFERGMKILKDNGHLVYITSNKWMRAGYGEKLRGFLARYNPKVLVDLGPKAFESAAVDTCIIVVQKSENEYRTKAVTIVDGRKDRIDIAEILRNDGVVLNKLGNDTWFIGDDAEHRLKEKIEHNGRPLKDWSVRTYLGIITGLNDAFIIDSATRNDILNGCRGETERNMTERFLKPILQGRDVDKYYCKWTGTWAIVIPAGWTDKNRKGEKPEIFIEHEIPSLMRYLKPFENKAKERYNKGDYWWELRNCTYYSEIEKEKVAWQRITQQPKFCLVDEGVYVLDSMAFFVSQQNMKYIMAVLNSSTILFYARKIVHQYGFTGLRLSNQYVEIMPIPIVTSENEMVVRQIEDLVDTLISIKKQDVLKDTSRYEREIDQLVYRLYELTDDEISVIERNVK
ncbi:MAG: class I SAM-dependent DNA methyltransferase [Thermotogaceae bacterium]|nr:class I SAM-dependent DNA methyltransferase [Thermotogaceae bacterium]HOV54332.1 TaqI-like C-terminal specificity domain-containing protein [Fervidobacterium sp.]HUM76614.1 TaqI-like C-terminal specificity domain-containing protein [Fervidobacterium sp.]